MGWLWWERRSGVESDCFSCVLVWKVHGGQPLIWPKSLFSPRPVSSLPLPHGSVWRPRLPPWPWEATLPTPPAFPQTALPGCEEGPDFPAPLPCGHLSYAKAPTAGHGGETKVACREEAHNVMKSYELSPVGVLQVCSLEMVPSSACPAWAMLWEEVEVTPEKTH